MPSYTVHPHVCGDYTKFPGDERGPLGSSPRVWGLQARDPPIRESRPVHPHVCGDYMEASLGSRLPAGSSPRVWGLRRDRSGDSRGDGSSPRVWGLRPQGVGHRGRDRFIPTCVGTTWRSPSDRDCPSVHPHVCGDYGWVNWEEIQQARFIPTCVGTTRSVAWPGMSMSGSSPRVWGLRWTIWGPTGRGPVHPHVCGDYAGGRMRLTFGERFIPTCVGTTRTREAVDDIYRGSSPRVWGLLSPVT